jgi:trypsin-like peptidase
MNNPLSYSSLKLDLFSREGGRLKSASGFVIETGNQYYLITNRHVLSGRDIPAQGQQEPVVEPYTLKTSLHIHGGKGERGDPPQRRGVRKRITVQLYDNNDAPRWMERQAHEPYQPMVDVVALPLQANLSTDLFLRTVLGSTIEEDGWSKFSAIPLSAVDTDVEYGPPDTVHIIGYPLGWAPTGTDKASAAFWRTSSIASEINEIGRIQAGTFFVDSSAPEGMTGSPVVGMKNDRMKLLGVYSDSSTAEFGANAGLVWDARLVKELIGTS